MSELTKLRRENAQLKKQLAKAEVGLLSEKNRSKAYRGELHKMIGKYVKLKSKNDENGKKGKFWQGFGRN